MDENSQHSFQVKQVIKETTETSVGNEISNTNIDSVNKLNNINILNNLNQYKQNNNNVNNTTDSEQNTKQNQNNQNNPNIIKKTVYKSNAFPSSKLINSKENKSILNKESLGHLAKALFKRAIEELTVSDQNFSSLYEEHMKKGIQFQDNDFPANYTSLVKGLYQKDIDFIVKETNNLEQHITNYEVGLNRSNNTNNENNNHTNNQVNYKSSSFKKHQESVNMNNRISSYQKNTSLGRISEDNFENNTNTDKGEYLEFGNSYTLGKVLHKNKIDYNNNHNVSNFSSYKSNIKSNEYLQDLSLFKQWNKIVWKRATDLFSDKLNLFPVINKSSNSKRSITTLSSYSRIINANEIKQGINKNSNLLCAISALGEKPYRISNLFLNKKSNLQGIYGIKLNHEGEWREIVIDDYLPCDSKKKSLCFASHVKDKTCFIWLSLLEKAFAKVYGSYYLIGNLSFTQILRDLTGAPIITFDNNKEDLWNDIKVGYNKGYLLAVSAGETQSSCELLSEVGLMPYNNYSILEAHEIETEEGTSEKLIKLKNHFGNSELLGDWAQMSALWREDIKAKLNINIDKDIKENSFWMNYKDLRYYFSKLIICKLKDDFFYESLRVNTIPKKFNLIKLIVSDNTSKVNPLTTNYNLNHFSTTNIMNSNNTNISNSMQFNVNVNSSGNNSLNNNEHGSFNYCHNRVNNSVELGAINSLNQMGYNANSNNKFSKVILCLTQTENKNRLERSNNSASNSYNNKENGNNYPLVRYIITKIGTKLETNNSINNSTFYNKYNNGSNSNNEISSNNLIYLDGTIGQSKEVMKKYYLTQGEYLIYLEIEDNKNSSNSGGFDDNSSFNKLKHSIFSCYSEKQCSISLLDNNYSNVLYDIFKSAALQADNKHYYTVEGAPMCYKVSKMCNSGYYYIYFNNKEEETTMIEDLKYTKFNGLKLLPPFSGTSYYVEVEPKKEELIIIKKTSTDGDSFDFSFSIK